MAYCAGMGRIPKQSASIIRGDEEMLATIRACKTLTEFRDRVLREDLKQVAKRAGVSIVSVHRVERGDLPKKYRKLLKYIEAFKMDRWPKEFERLAKGGAA